MNNDTELDLLDLEDDATLDTIPGVSPFETPRPKRPWLLLGLGVLVIVLATYIIIRAIGTGPSDTVEIDLDAPAIEDVVPADDTIVVPPAPAVVTPPPAPTNVAATPGVPSRSVEDRNNTATFNPASGTTAGKPAQPAVAPKPATSKPKPAVTPAKPKTATTSKPTAAVTGGWYVQFGSYSTRALAEAAQKKIGASHSGLFTGKQFVILAAQVNGKTTYRLRIAFANQNDANMFCRNAKSDGLDCYVAK